MMPRSLIEAASSSSSALGEMATRVAGIGPQEFDRHAPLAARALERGDLVADIADQRGKPAAQTGLSSSAIAASLAMRIPRLFFVTPRATRARAG